MVVALLPSQTYGLICFLQNLFYICFMFLGLDRTLGNQRQDCFSNTEVVDVKGLTALGQRAR